MTELLPCKKCGTKPKYCRTAGNDFFLQCPSCDERSTSYELFSEADEDWNRYYGKQPDSKGEFSGLLPCKKCGDTPSSHLLARFNSPVFVSCGTCLITTPFFDDTESALDYWNKEYGNHPDPVEVIGLLPCKKCGEMPTTSCHKAGNTMTFFVPCPAPLGVCTNCTCYYETEEEAINAWNEQYGKLDVDSTEKPSPDEETNRPVKSLQNLIELLIEVEYDTFRVEPKGTDKFYICFDFIGKYNTLPIQMIIGPPENRESPDVVRSYTDDGVGYKTYTVQEIAEKIKGEIANADMVIDHMKAASPASKRYIVRCIKDAGIIERSEP